MGKIVLPPPMPGTSAPWDFTIDWPDLKDATRKVFRGEDLGIRSRNLECFSGLTRPGSWEGYNRDQVERWIREGFESEAIAGLGDSLPARNKRRILMSDDGDEISVADALSGEEYFMIKHTLRPVVPGVSLDCIVTFAAGTPADVVNRYNVWICRSAYTMEQEGIDLGITLNFQVENTLDGKRGLTNSRVRVKREGEIMDFVSISPMLSPAAFRGFLFAATGLHAEARKTNASYGLGSGPRSMKFGVRYDKTTKMIVVTSQREGANEFPEARMTAELKAALAESRMDNQ